MYGDYIWHKSHLTLPLYFIVQAHWPDVFLKSRLNRKLIGFSCFLEMRKTENENKVIIAVGDFVSDSNAKYIVERYGIFRKENNTKGRGTNVIVAELLTFYGVSGQVPESQTEFMSMYE